MGKLNYYRHARALRRADWEHLDPTLCQEYGNPSLWWRVLMRLDDWRRWVGWKWGDLRWELYWKFEGRHTGWVPFVPRDAPKEDEQE